MIRVNGTKVCHACGKDIKGTHVIIAERILGDGIDVKSCFNYHKKCVPVSMTLRSMHVAEAGESEPDELKAILANAEELRVENALKPPAERDDFQMAYDGLLEQINASLSSKAKSRN